MLVNESPLDPGLRAVAAVIVLVVAFVVGSGSVASIILIVAAVLAVTAGVGFCPLYRIVGIRTAKPEATLPS